MPRADDFLTSSVQGRKSPTKYGSSFGRALHLRCAKRATTSCRADWSASTASTSSSATGGFGTVYRAVHPLIGKRVAIKVLARKYSADPEIVSRFVAEARAVNQIRHRNIIDIFSFGQLADGRHYYVMEYLDGEPLDALPRASSGRSPLAEALPILRAIARALDAAHAQGHRAPRSQARERVPRASTTTAAVPEAARLRHREAARRRGRCAPQDRAPARRSARRTTCRPSSAAGTNVDHRTDIYSFGVIGVRDAHRPPSVSTATGRSRSSSPRHEGAARRCLRSLRHSPALDGPVLAMLAKDPNDRPATAGAAIDALTGYADTLPPSLPMHSWPELERAPSPRRPRRWLLIPFCWASAPGLASARCPQRDPRRSRPP